MIGGPAPRDSPSRKPRLITGATGFIGGHLAERLVAEGHHVRCLARDRSDTSRLSALDVEIVRGDLTDDASLQRAVVGCSAVFHCAALVTDWATRKEIVQANVDGTRSLLDAAQRASVTRFIHLSTTDVYGHPGTRDVAEDEVSRRFANWYAATKLDAERAVREASGSHALETVVLRPATVYGPGSREVIGEIARAIRGRNMVLVGKGQSVAGLCYVENLVDAMILALRHDGAPGRVFNVTDGLPVTWRQLVDDLADGLGCPRVRFSLPYGPAHAIGFTLEHAYRVLRRTTGLTLAPLLSRQAVQVLGVSQDFSNERARAVLGWRPRVSYTEGLRETLAWLTSDYLRPN